MLWVALGVAGGALLASAAVWVYARALAAAAAALIRDQRLQLDARGVAVTALEHRVSELALALDRTSGTALRAELAELTTAVLSDRTSMRRELGRIWSRMGPAAHTPNDPASNSELDAFLELQRGFSNGD